MQRRRGDGWYPAEVVCTLRVEVEVAYKNHNLGTWVRVPHPLLGGRYEIHPKKQEGYLMDW